MIAMWELDDNLRNNLLVKKYNPNDKFHNLWNISRQLEAIHELIHNGNVLCIMMHMIML